MATPACLRSADRRRERARVVGELILAGAVPSCRRHCPSAPSWPACQPASPLLCGKERVSVHPVIVIILAAVRRRRNQRDCDPERWVWEEDDHAMQRGGRMDGRAAGRLLAASGQTSGETVGTVQRRAVGWLEGPAELECSGARSKLPLAPLRWVGPAL